MGEFPGKKPPKNSFNFFTRKKQISFSFIPKQNKLNWVWKPGKKRIFSQGFRFSYLFTVLWCGSSHQSSVISFVILSILSHFHRRKKPEEKSQKGKFLVKIISREWQEREREREREKMIYDQCFNKETETGIFSLQVFR